MMDSREEADLNAASLLDFVLTLDGLKAVERRTRPSGIMRPENSAEHSWHGAMCALLLKDYCAFAVDAQHAALLMVVHDIPEIVCGDTFIYDPARDAAHLSEEVALGHLLAKLPVQNATQLRSLWEEFTAGQTPEARYANALDRIMPVLHNLANDGHTWREYSIKLEQVLARNQCVAEVLPRLWAIIRPRIEAAFSGAHNE